MIGSIVLTSMSIKLKDHWQISMSFIPNQPTYSRSIINEVNRVNSTIKAMSIPPSVAVLVRYEKHTLKCMFLSCTLGTMWTPSPGWNGAWPTCTSTWLTWSQTPSWTRTRYHWGTCLNLAPFSQEPWTQQLFQKCFVKWASNCSWES